MRSIILQIAILVFSVSCSMAQPVLRNIENLSLGSNAKYISANEVGVNAGQSGESVTWNFNNLALSNDTIAQKIVIPASAPQGANFPDANMAQQGTDGTVIFLNQKPDTTYVVGIVEPNFGITMKYSDPYTFLSRPFTFRDSVKDKHARSYTLQGSTYKGSGTSLTTADGFGSLILGGKVYDDVLRIKFEQLTYDTSTTNGTVITIKVVSYAWYNSLRASALLTIDSVSISSLFFSESVKTVNVLVSELNTDVNEGPQVSVAKLKAFIQDNSLVISNSNTFASADIALINTAGQTVQKEKVQSTGNGTIIFPLDVHNLTPGIYFVKLDYKRNGRLQQDYIKVLKM